MNKIKKLKIEKTRIIKRLFNSLININKKIILIENINNSDFEEESKGENPESNSVFSSSSSHYLSYRLSPNSG